MPNKLEKYLNSSRGELDVETPDDQLIWEGIRQGLYQDESRQERKLTFSKIRNVAAIALLIISLGFVSFELTFNLGNRNISLAKFDEELGNKEKEYISLVKDRQNEISAYKRSKNIIVSEILDEIQELDTEYVRCLKDLKELGYDDRIVNTIFDTYEQKIFLLELIILENNKTIHHEKEVRVFL